MKISAKFRKVVNLKTLATVLLAAILLMGALKYSQDMKESSLRQDKLQSDIDNLTKRVGDFTYNPNSLSECLDRAANEYMVFIQMNGKTEIRDDTPNYSMSEDQWKTANSTYELAKQDCKNMFGRVN